MKDNNIIETVNTKIKIYSKEEFENVIKGKRFNNRNNQSQVASPEFAGTESLEEAEKLRTNGDMDSYRQIQYFVNKFISYTKFNKKISKNKEDVVGFAPNVSATLMGVPKNMFNREERKLPMKEISIAISPTFNSKYTTQEIITFGTVMISLIDKLENENIKVNLFTLFNMGVDSEVVKVRHKKERHYYSPVTQAKATAYDIGRLLRMTDKKIARYKDVVKTYYETFKPTDEKDFNTEGFLYQLKKASDPLNTFDCAYYIVNPSFLRRHCLKILESDPFFTDVTFDNYGVASLKSSAMAEQAIKKKYKDVTFFSVWNSDFTDSDLIEEYIEAAYARLNKEFPDIFKRKQKER